MTLTCPSCQGQSDDGLLCQREVLRYSDDLHEIIDLWVELDLTLTRQTKTGGGNTGIKKTEAITRPLPYNGHASDLGHEVRDTLTMWVRAFNAGDTMPTNTVPAISAWLLERPTQIRAHADVSHFVDELPDLVRRMRRAIDLRPEMIYIGPCPAQVALDQDGQPVYCKHQMYAGKRDEGYECTGEPGVPCGALYNVEKRRTELLALAANHHATVNSCAQVLGMFGLPLKADTLDTWTRPRIRTDHQGNQHIQRGPRLWRVAVNERGQSLYRIGDVEALVRESMTKKERVA
jgi:hypothetical protein